MAWNNGYERNKFNEEQMRLAEEYRAAGMTEEQIEQIQQFDLEAFNSKRRYYEHTQQLPEDVLEESDDDKSPILEKFLEEFSVDISFSPVYDQFRWIDEIDNPELAKAVRLLSPEDMKIITLYVFEDRTVREIAVEIGISKSTVFQRIERFRKNFKNISEIVDKTAFSSATT